MKNQTNERIRALSKYLEVDADEVSESKYDEKMLEYGTQTYLVVTDDEADELWNEELENYVEEIILSELPEAYQSYFDSEKWKRDAKHDGRGHALSKYDGDEHEVRVGVTLYYIYRQD